LRIGNLLEGGVERLADAGEHAFHRLRDQRGELVAFELVARPASRRVFATASVTSMRVPAFWP
jgi:hypothetical protein